MIRFLGSAFLCLVLVGAITHVARQPDLAPWIEDGKAPAIFIIDQTQALLGWTSTQIGNL